MPYTNWDDAWDSFSDGFVYVRAATTDLFTLWTQIFVGQGLAAFQGKVKDALFKIYVALSEHAETYSGASFTNSHHYQAVFYAREVTMRLMLDAMKIPEYDEVSEWLSINWAYQQIMWDQPFFPENYTALINEIRT